MHRRIALYGLMALWLVALATMISACQTATPTAPPFPTKSITIIVPFKPGGGFDLQARMLAQTMPKYLPTGASVVIQNVDGAGGRLGANQLAKSKNDGYTIGVLGLESVSFMQALGQLDDDPRKWTYLGQLSSDPLLVAVSAAGPIKSVPDMKSKDYRFGVTSEMLPSGAAIAKAIGGNYRPILFDGSGEAVLAAQRGDLDAVVFSWPTMIKGVQDSQGKINSLFVVNKQRVPQLKDVPTLEELGVKADDALYSVVATSRTVVGPSGIDKNVRDILVNAISKTVADPEFKANMDKGQFVIVTDTPESLQKRVTLAVDEFGRVVDMVKSFVK